MKPFYVYILRCRNGAYYVGHTDNIEKRLCEHAEGKASVYTAALLPVQLVFLEEFSTRTEAFNAEHKLKGWTRDKKEVLINHGWEALEGFVTKKEKEILRLRS